MTKMKFTKKPLQPLSSNILTLAFISRAALLLSMILIHGISLVAMGEMMELGAVALVAGPNGDGKISLFGA